MQKKRNIKLFIVLLLVILSAVSAYFITRPADKLQVDRDIFSYEDVSGIDRVVFATGDAKHEISFQGNVWSVGDTYSADAQRVSVLFAIIKQMRVRRQVSTQQEETIQKKLENEGTKVSFYEGGAEIHGFYVWGDEESGLTYLAESPEEQAYIVEIPGYRSFLAGIFQLDKNGWRDPLVFDINWANLSEMSVRYPDDEEKSFSIGYDGNYYQVVGLDKTDSVKLTDFLDDVSLLYVNDFINSKEKEQYSEILTKTPQALFIIEDLGKNKYTLEIYGKKPDGVEMLARIDSTDYALLDIRKVQEVTKPRSYFRKKESADIK